MTRRDLLKAAAAVGASVARAQQAAGPLAGPGGNVVVLHGLDGKVVIDTFVQGAFVGLKQRVDATGPEPILYAIDTHWHFDHADNNESFRKAGATIIAHANTRKRLSESHDMLGMHFNPAPAAALPSETFTQTHQLKLNNEYIELG